MNYYRTITYQPPTSVLTNFPLLARIQNDPMTSRISNANGYDVCFEDSAGNTLSFDLDYYDPVTHSGAWWVKIPSLSSSTSTSIKMRYGDSTITTNQSTPLTVWADYAAVYHLSDLTTTSQLNSATGVRDSAGLNSASFMSMDKGTGRALSFVYTGSAEDRTQGIITPMALTGPNYSMMAIMNSPGGARFVFIFTPNQDATLAYSQNANFTAFPENITFRAGVYPLNGSLTIPFESAGFVLLGGSLDRGNYRNIQINSSFASGHSGEDYQLQAYNEFISLISAWDGTYTYTTDELRFCTVPHTQDWMRYEHENYMNHSANASYGPEMNSDGTRVFKFFPWVSQPQTLN